MIGFLDSYKSHLFIRGRFGSWHVRWRDLTFTCRYRSASSPLPVRERIKVRVLVQRALFCARFTILLPCFGSWRVRYVAGCGG